MDRDDHEVSDTSAAIIAPAASASYTASYAYDAQSRRKSKTVGSTTTLYVTDADNREVLEYDGTSGAIGAWYAFGPGADGVLNRMNVTAASRQTMIPDIQGSIIGTLDSGGVLSKAGYQAFGENPTTTTGSYRYTGRRIDPETGGGASQPSGLYYYRARMYSPTWGRFLQGDPVGYGGGANLYVYVGNDPLDLDDPGGTLPGLGTVVGAGIGAWYGAVGALGTPKATWQSVVSGTLVGGVVGGVIGTFDPSPGIVTMSLIGGTAGTAGDLAGQVTTNVFSGSPPFSNLNYGSALSAGLGGSIAGAGGAGLTSLGGPIAASALGAVGIASITAGPGTFFTLIGGQLYNSMVNSQKYRVEVGDIINVCVTGDANCNASANSPGTNLSTPSVNPAAQGNSGK
jgi:RHS repeat-associated protein